MIARDSIRHHMLHSDEVELWLPGEGHEKADYDEPLSETRAAKASASQRKPLTNKAATIRQGAKCY